MHGCGETQAGRLTKQQWLGLGVRKLKSEQRMRSCRFPMLGVGV